MNINIRTGGRGNKQWHVKTMIHDSDRYELIGSRPSFPLCTQRRLCRLNYSVLDARGGSIYQPPSTCTLISIVSGT